MGSEKRGFALVVALSLMSIMLLIILSMTTLTKVELESSRYELSRAAARENARLGMLVAVGHLQSTAGDDQRVTAQANLIDGGVQNQYWTGVWDSTDGSLVSWLVSGNANQGVPSIVPSDALGDTVRLFGDASSGNDINAPLVDAGDAGAGHYAYSIMDEGVKARINLEDSAWESTDELVLSRAREASQRLGVEEIEAWNIMRDSRGDADWGRRLGQLFSQDQVDMLYADVADDSSVVAAGQHDMETTVVSNSLAVSVANGGFRNDLSRILESGYNAAPYQDSDLILSDATLTSATWGMLRGFANPWGRWDEANGTMPMVTPTAPSTTQAGLFPLPVIVQIGWGAIRSGAGAGATLQVTMKPVVALANPYDVSLAASDYQVIVQPDSGRGLMMLSFEPEPDYGSSEFVEGVHTRAKEFYPVDLLGEYPTFTMRRVSFEPGEVKLFGLAGNGEYPAAGSEGAILSEAYPSSNYVWKDTGRQLGSHTRGPDGRVTMQISGGRYSLKFNMNDGGGWQSLQDVEEVGIGMSPSSSQLNDGGQPKVQVRLEPDGVDGLPPSINLIRRRFKMRSSETEYVSDNYTGTGLRWLADFNPRATENNRRPTGWVSHPLWLADAGNTNNHLPLNSDWITDFQLDLGDGDARGFWGDSTNAIGESVVTLFSVPRQPIGSLGFLQHAPFSGNVWDPSYAFGNSYASPFVATGAEDLSYALNEFFWDDFFFSGIDRDSDGASLNSSNPRMELLNDLGAPLYENPALAAAGLFIEGGFNVNSTSLEAWKAILSNFAGLSLNYYDTNAGSMQVVNLESSYFRLLNPNGDDGEPWSGFHSLTPNQVENLAAQIVSRIQSRGRPFTSLAEFVNRLIDANSGLIQEAIDSESAVVIDGQTYPASGINTPLKGLAVTSYDSGAALNTEAGLGARSTAAPGWLTQADVLTAIGPYLNVRSDTFVIRSYGDSVNPVTGDVEAEAICEAIVQRFPEAVSPASSVPGSAGYYQPSDAMGRQFKVIGIRWLSKGEI